MTKLWPAIVITAWALPAWPQGALMPKPGQDLSAHRVDTDVFGWNKELTEVAAIGLDVKRGVRGEQRGEGFVLVFDIGQVVPKHNVHVLYITQAAMPHDPTGPCWRSC